MKRKGFTLVELLAVIAILAIISVITTPIILNVIESAKKGAFREAVNGLVRAVDNADASSGFNNERTILVRNGKATYTENGETKEVDTKGDMAIDGYILTNIDGDVTYQLQNEKWCAMKAFTGSMNLTKGKCASINPPTA